MNTNKKIKLLKKNQEDFEFYPTTDEIFEAMRKDLKIKKAYAINTDWREKKDSLIIKSFIDIGTGDGRVFEYLEKEEKKFKLEIIDKYGIEKTKFQADDLIRNGVKLIGRDFFETSLINRTFDIVFSNPPYSCFKEWCVKLITEINAGSIYLVIPERWKNDNALKRIFEEKGNVEIIGNYDFLNAERKARAKVDLIRIIPKKGDDTFKIWIEKNIGEFKNDEPILDEYEKRQKDNKWIEKRDSNDTIKILIKNYNDELQKTLKTYKQLGELDFSIIQQLGVKKEDVIDKIKNDIKGLKNIYWRKTFNFLETITSKLTSKTRNQILSEITWFSKLDYNFNNVYTIIIWVIENYNKYIKEQLFDLFKSLTDFDKVREYKSNDKWIKDNWRYTKDGGKGTPEKYSLDYRIVVRNNMYYASYRSSKLEDNLSIVAETLGFSNSGASCGNCLLNDTSLLFDYKNYKNGNIHFKIDKKLLKKINIEVGKLRGWIRKPQDIMDEFDVKEEEAIRLFKNNQLRLIGENDIKLLN